MISFKPQQLYEKIYPYLFSIAAAYLAYKYGHNLGFKVTDTQISNTTTIASIFMGFLGTSYGILLSASSKRIEWAKGKQVLWKSILGFFNQSFISNFLLCVYSIALSTSAAHGLYFELEKWIFVIWVLLITLSIISFYRAMRILLGLLKSDS